MAITAKVVRRERVAKMFDLLDPNINAALAGMTVKVTEDLVQKFKSYAPVKSGDYRNSIHADKMANRPDAKPVGQSRSTDPNAMGVFGAWYWHFIEFGTRPHPIKARTAPFMVFEGRDGTLKYMREVQHPGSPPQPHIFPVYRSERKNMKRRLARVVNRAVKKAIDNQQATPNDGNA